MFMILLISCVLLGPDQTPPRANPAPNADLEAYQSMQAKAGRDPAAHIRMALWCEQHGLNAEKMKHLALAVLRDPQNTMARGLMGLLPNGGRWEAPEAVSARLRADELLMARLAEYNRRRDELQAFENSTIPVGTTVQNRWALHHPAAEVAAAHARLGVWCEQNGLKPEATAHFTQAVVLDPYRDSAWKHLGFVKHNGRWMDHEQITAEEKEAIEQTRADRLWEPQLKRWKAWLKDEKRRDQATTEMKSVTDPHAVPAVVRILAQGNERDQMAAAQLLGQIDIPSSTRALLQLAVFSASDAVRAAATEAFRRREPRDFAGWLVDTIRTPWQYRVQPVGGPGSPGALQIVTPRFTMLRTYDAPPAFTLSDQFYGYVGYDVNGLPVVVRGAEMNSMAKLAALDARAPSGKLHQLELRTQMLLAEANLKAVDSQQRLIADVNDIEAANAKAVAINQRITPILTTTLDAPDLKNDEDAWKTWWYDRLGYRYDPPPPVSLAVDASPQYAPPRIYSCFVAGTPVRTINGHQPIESVRVGDRLLTQDVTTGALSFQSVLVVHHNAPAKTIRVALDNGETITASTYHRFWQVGKGWAMAKQLQTGDTLRTLGGIARVVSLEPGATVPVFNLDVAGTRTFFVGMKDALVHDNTLPNPHLEPFDAVNRESLSVQLTHPAGK